MVVMGAAKSWVFGFIVAVVVPDGLPVRRQFHLVDAEYADAERLPGTLAVRAVRAYSGPVGSYDEIRLAKAKCAR